MAGLAQAGPATLVFTEGGVRAHRNPTAHGVPEWKRCKSGADVQGPSPALRRVEKCGCGKPSRVLG